MTDELLDLVNKDGTVIGKALRSECHSNPKLIHPVVHCWIFNNKGQVLWQQRSLSKKESPGKWDMSVGGHLPAGESPIEGLKREFEEELGVSSSGIKFKLVDKYIRGNEYQTEYIYILQLWTKK